MDREELKAKLESKWVLLDTNVLISSSRHIQQFTPIFELFEEANCTSATFEFIQFEHLRDAFLPATLAERQKKLEQTIQIPLPKNYIKSAIEISQIYANAKIRKEQISFVDCLIAVLLMTHAKDLFLLTGDHKDFPLLLFDRHHIFPIDGESEVLTPALYSFNKDKYTKRLEAISKVT